ncbi:lysis inhibition; accessory protein [Acinetobacter phage Acj9]|uniref:Lysis inhibition accessory protein n=1 Tax=Acinetobacter phage Acj9 TaxID=760939 RepID=E5EPZ5_9CAUD|nr:lysis inhibition; accessory protein [Acinetobacter phage Acj9]ADG60111.1 rIII lysis inhibition accessory protein [Acinetobacter phage Acj9]
MDEKIQHILNIQRQAWNRGHENYGTTLDVLASAKHYLEYFKHLNPAQKRALEAINRVDEIKYAKRLCSRAHKAVRHLVVSLK